jgi:uncharacterized protein (DUF486 family)
MVKARDIEWSVMTLASAGRLVSVFAAFSVLYLGERITLNHLVGFALICAGAFFVFKGPLPT